MGISDSVTDEYIQLSACSASLRALHLPMSDHNLKKHCFSIDP